MNNPTKHLSSQTIVQASPTEVFGCLDDMHEIGKHMTESSMPLMGSKLKFEILSPNVTDIGATYRYYGKIMGLPLDITEVVRSYKMNEEKYWETIGEPKIIIMSHYVLGFQLQPTAGGTQATFVIDYEIPQHGLSKILGLLLSNWYAHWCLRMMLDRVKKVNLN